MQTTSNATLRCLLVLLACSVGANVFQAIRAASTNAHTPSKGIAAGTVLPPLKGKTLTGESWTLTYSGSGPTTVLYVFSPTCQWCEVNTASINHLAQTLSPKYRLIGVARDGVGIPAYVQAHGYTFPIVVEPDDASRSAYALTSVPKTLVISPQGTLLDSFDGAYVGPLHRRVSAFFATSIPEAPFPEVPAAQATQLCKDAKGLYPIGSLVDHAGRLEQCTAGGVWRPANTQS